MGQQVGEQVRVGESDVAQAEAEIGRRRFGEGCFGRFGEDSFVALRRDEGDGAVAVAQILDHLPGGRAEREFAHRGSGLLGASAVICYLEAIAAATPCRNCLSCLFVPPWQCRPKRLITGTSLPPHTSRLSFELLTGRAVQLKIIDYMWRTEFPKEFFSLLLAFSGAERWRSRAGSMTINGP